MSVIINTDAAARYVSTDSAEWLCFWKAFKTAEQTPRKAFTLI